MDGVQAMSDGGTVATSRTQVQQVDSQTRRLQAYVAAGGGDPAPDPAIVAALAAGPIPIDQVQQVQALLAQTRRLSEAAVRAAATDGPDAEAAKAVYTRDGSSD